MTLSVQHFLFNIFLTLSSQHFLFNIFYSTISIQHFLTKIFYLIFSIKHFLFNIFYSTFLIWHFWFDIITRLTLCTLRSGIFDLIKGKQLHEISSTMLGWYSLNSFFFVFASDHQTFCSPFKVRRHVIGCINPDIVVTSAPSYLGGYPTTSIQDMVKRI